MQPLKALRHLEVAAERIRSGPQVSPSEIQALRALSNRVKRWRLVYLWEYLQFDAEAEPNRLIGAQQNLSAALRGIAYELKTELLGPSELAAFMAAGDLACVTSAPQNQGDRCRTLVGFTEASPSR